MKKIKYILFTILILILSTLSVNAECTKEELNTLKQEANKIKVTYKHLGAIEVEGGVKEYNHFTITFKNINEDFYMSDVYNGKYEIDKDNSLSFETTTGSYKYFVNSKKCESKISEIRVKIPKFNTYSLDPLCKSIDSTDFPLCGKYYDYEVSYDTFKRKAEEYKMAHEIKNDDSKNTNEQFSIKIILNKILEFITNYQIYIITALGILLLILIIIIIVSKKKKRGVLE